MTGGPAPFVHICLGCGAKMGKHLRVQLAPPKRPWFMVRVCDLLCLLDWLEDEQEGPDRALFKDARWRDHTASPTVTVEGPPAP